MPHDNSHRKWWKEKTAVHSAVFQNVQYLENQQSYKETANVRNMRLYGNFEYGALRATAFRNVDSSNGLQHRVTLNVVQSMIDTVVSKITKNKPKPTFLTDGGSWSEQSKAKKLNQFTEGMFSGADFYQKASMAFQDSCIFGTGAIKTYREGNQIKCERVFINELQIDDSEAAFGLPRQMHQVKYMHRDVLKQMFPSKVGDIETAGADGYGGYNPKTVLADNPDMIRVIESWHLPSGKVKDAEGGPKKHDGKRAITIDNATLLEEPWKKDYFPFVFWRWGVRPVGFFGQGIAEQLTGLQLEINKILRTIQVSMHLVSIPKIYVEAGSKVVSAHLNNKIGGIVKYAGTPPIDAKLGTIPTELFSHLDRLYTRAYEVIGISQLSAQSSKPSGLDSGKAIREFNDIETERFMSVGLRYEQVFIDAAEIMIDIAKDISEDTGDFSVKVKGKIRGQDFLKTVKWSEINLEDDKYEMQVFPTSALSNTPSGRLQDVQELLTAGFISKEDGMKLLDFPDLKAFYNFNNAGLEDIERQIEQMIDDGNYETPEPYQNLQLGVIKMQQAYLLFRSQGAPEARLELFRRWIEDANALVQRGTQPPAPNPLAALPTTAEPAPGAAQLQMPNAGAPTGEKPAV